MQKTISIVLLLVLISCSKETKINVNTSECDNEGAYSTCLTPKFPPEYYIEQGEKYFLSMQSDIPIDVKPNHSDLVIRWEWPPWLFLTGYTRDFLTISDILLKLYPTKYDLIDCRFFETQPFCRCHVIFNYSGTLCPIYEEFVFNDQGEITFIEAWSDYESLLPMDAGEDGIWSEEEYWAMQDNVRRLSTKVPGLGNETGRIKISSPYMQYAAEKDEDVKELVRRLKDPIKTYFETLSQGFKGIAEECVAPQGDIYPYYFP